MASEAAIKGAIKKHVSYYPAWTIGVTDNPKRRRTEHGDPTTWYQWDADTQAVARSIEAHFIAEGMKGGTGGGGGADYVYIFI